VITGIEIQRLRGIREGKLAGLTQLTVLVGASGAGKSTILDAMLIGTSGSPGDAIGRVIRRRAELPAGGRWLFERAADPGYASARIAIQGDALVARTCMLSRTPDSDRAQVGIEATIESGLYGSFKASTVVAPDNRYTFELDAVDDTSGQTPPSANDPLHRKAEFQSGSRPHLIEVAAGANHEPLHRLFTRALERGAEGVLRETISSVVPGATGLVLLTYFDGERDPPILHVSMDGYTVPLSAAGSGIYAVMRLALELAAIRGGVALIEEPEVHQHPAAIYQSAKLLIAAMLSGMQVIVSTHSLDLIDSLVSILTTEHPDQLDQFSVVRVALDRGKLRSSHFAGPRVVSARSEIDEDLR